MNTLSQDFRYGVRSLVRSPGFTIVSVLTLGLGIGATTSIFSVVNSVVLKPLPYPDSDRLTAVWTMNERTETGLVSYPDLRDWRDLSTTFSELGGHFMLTHRFEREYGTEEMRGEALTVGVLPLLGVTPHLGRWFTEEEDRIGGPAAIILRHDVWANRYGGDSSIVGTSIVVSDEPVMVVGVMPRGFSYPTPQTQFWMPAREDEWLIKAGFANSGRSVGFMRVIGRLQPNVDLNGATREIQMLAARVNTEEVSGDGESIRLENLHQFVTGGTNRMLFTFLGAVLMVLAIACANVANLALARASARQREISIRTALGAGRWRLSRQLLTESLLLASLGGFVGVLIATGAIEAFATVGSSMIPRGDEIRIDRLVLVFTALTTIACGIAFGLFPAFQSASWTATSSLRDETRGTTGARRTQVTRHALVVAQVAAAMVLLTGGALLTNSFVRLTSIDPGFDTENALTARIELPTDQYDGNDDAVLAFYDEVVARVRALPGVTNAATSYSLPFSGNYFRQVFVPEGQELTDASEGPWAGTVIVSDEYFESAGLELVRGRRFDASDRGGPRVAIVNQTMADQTWPGEDPIGKRFQIVGAIAGSVGSLERRFYSRDPMTVVGVASDVRRSSLGEPVGAEFYRPHSQMAWSGMSILVRTANVPESVIGSIRHEVWDIEPGATINDINTVQQLVAQSVATPRFRTVLLAVFAGAAGLLAVIGVYGVIAFVVAQRTQEIGIRMALGAGDTRVMRDVLWQGFRLAGVGVALGLIGAIASSRVLASMLFGISEHDPATYAATAAVLLAVATLACYYPARRASRVDPLEALREA